MLTSLFVIQIGFFVLPYPYNIDNWPPLLARAGTPGCLWQRGRHTDLSLPRRRFAPSTSANQMVCLWLCDDLGARHGLEFASPGHTFPQPSRFCVPTFWASRPGTFLHAHSSGHRHRPAALPALGYRYPHQPHPGLCWAFGKHAGTVCAGRLWGKCALAGTERPVLFVAGNGADCGPVSTSAPMVAARGEPLDVWGAQRALSRALALRATPGGDVAR